MSNLSRRPGSGLSRNARERRAFQFVVVGGTAAAIAAVTFVLAVIGVMGFGIFLLALVVAIASGVLFRRTTGT
jgi:putative flippase GtrA